MRGNASRHRSGREQGGRARVEPSGHLIEVRAGESLIQAAWREGYEWPTLCYGMGTCTACQCEILDGLENVSDKTEAEDAMLSDFSRRRRRIDPRRVRLACQVRISGDIEVRKPGVRVAENQTAERSGP